MKAFRLAGFFKSLRARIRNASPAPLPISERREFTTYHSISRLDNHATADNPAVPKKPTRALPQSRKY